LELGFEDGGETLGDEEESFAINEAKVAGGGESVKSAAIGFKTVGADFGDQLFYVFEGRQLIDAVNPEAAAVGLAAILGGAIENTIVYKGRAARARAGDAGLHGVCGMRVPGPLESGSERQKELQIGSGFLSGMKHPPAAVVEKDGGVDAIHALQEGTDALPPFRELHSSVEGDLIFFQGLGNAKDLAISFQQKGIRLVNRGIVEDASGKRNGIGESTAAIEGTNSGNGALVFYLVEILEQNHEFGATLKGKRISEESSAGQRRQPFHSELSIRVKKRVNRRSDNADMPLFGHKKFSNMAFDGGKVHFSKGADYAPIQPGDREDGYN
jgi:hypothetical protein